MKKRFLAIAIASTLVSPLAANAGDATIYGRVHLTMDHVEKGDASASSTNTSWNFNSRKSALGFKGKEDLGGGMKVFYKMEWDVDITGTSGTGISTRDRYIGIKTAGMGTIKMGALTTSYKQTTAWVDPFWHTIAEGRGDLTISSGLAGGRGVDRGRGTDTFQYRSPKMGGMQMIINRTFSGNQNGENLGVGFRYTSKTIKAFFDYVDIQTGTAFNNGESATKLGGTYKIGGTTIGLQLEQTEDLTNSDYTMVSVKQKVSDSGTILFSYGMRDSVVSLTNKADDKANSNDSFGLGYNHSMSKRTNVYAAYASKSDDATGANDLDMLSLGIKHTF